MKRDFLKAKEKIEILVEKGLKLDDTEAISKIVNECADIPDNFSLTQSERNILRDLRDPLHDRISEIYWEKSKGTYQGIRDLVHQYLVDLPAETPVYIRCKGIDYKLDHLFYERDKIIIEAGDKIDYL